MAVPNGRSTKRIQRELVVELAPPDASDLKEAAIAQNVSARGMRVATEHVWRPGDSVLLSSAESGFRTQARVVYCQRLENNKFAIGLELLALPQKWTM
jgi:PilZ domain